VDRAVGQGGGQRGGAVPGVEDDQRRPCAAVAGRVQAAQEVLDLPYRLPGAGGLGGPLDVDQAGQAVRRCPIAAVNWYSQPGIVLRVASQRHAS
jgi:hypothetical protein